MFSELKLRFYNIDRFSNGFINQRFFHPRYNWKRRYVWESCFCECSYEASVKQINFLCFIFIYSIVAFCTLLKYKQTLVCSAYKKPFHMLSNKNESENEKKCIWLKISHKHHQDTNIKYICLSTVSRKFFAGHLIKNNHQFYPIAKLPIRISMKK